MHTNIQPIKWQQDKLALLDQRVLPHTETYLVYTHAAEVAQAITDMVVRGAPAIGITAAYAVVLAARRHYARDPNTWQHTIQTDLQILREARPTAVNLAWAVDYMAAIIPGLKGDPEAELLAAAKRLHQEDIQANQAMGELGASLIEAPCEVITHCNAGALATGGYGTALGVIRSAHAQGKILRVYADETRPWLQGARLTAWELAKDNIPVSLLVDSAASYLMRQGKVRWVIVGSDRIVANGDVVNKIGTYQLAVSARYHGVKFMVAAPTSTIDMATETGAEVAIEQRPESEVSHVGDQLIAARGVSAINPAFDVTPAELVDAIVTERGVVLEPNGQKLTKLMQNQD